MKKKYKLNLTWGIIVFIIGTAIFILWYQGQQNSHEFALAKLQAEQKEKQQVKIEACLLKADEEYKRKFELNSVEGTTPGGDKARKWNNTDVANEANDNYRQDKEFCIKLYK